LCSLGNGYFATRGAGPEAEADSIHYPRTYLAGGYNRLHTELAGDSEGEEKEFILEGSPSRRSRFAVRNEK
jgi:trehalose/maltose hydrolase-like predicted phosphorylase